MKIDLTSLKIRQFGVGRDIRAGQEFVEVPTNAAVKDNLTIMLEETWKQMVEDEPRPTPYNPANRHASNEHLYIEIDNPHVLHLRDLHNADGLPIDSAALQDTGPIFCYFFRAVDRTGNRVTGVRRSVQFKAALSPRAVYLRFVDDALTLVEDKLFRLDRDFDFLITDERLHIWRPSGFEFTGRLQQAITDAVPANIQSLNTSLSYIIWEPIKGYALEHPRAARYIASIKQNNQLAGINPHKLMDICKETAVDLVKTDEGLVVTPGHELGFLEVLDRRRYHLELVPGAKERYRASSRTKL